VLALNILFFHFTPPHTRIFSPFTDNGFVFVGFFFLLSGYVLAYNYADRALTLNARQFWVARFARLYPIYLLGLAVSFQMLEAEWQVRTHPQFWTGFLLTPVLLQGWDPRLATYWNTVGWTLSSELLLYGSFPWVVRAWQIHASALNTTRRLIVIFLGLWLLGMVPHGLYMIFNPDHLSEPISRYSYGMWLRALKYTPPSYVCMFLAGITLGKLQLRLVISDQQRFAVALAGVAGVGLFFYTMVTHVPYILMHGGLLLPLFAVLTIGLSGANPVASVFAWKPLLVIGETTFCLYILHFNSINLLRNYHVWERLHVTALDPWITYAAALAIAALAHYLVEAPARRMILKRFGTRPAVSAS